MRHMLKSISKTSIPEAMAKAELYRNLNEPEEAESICRDILSTEPGHQLARRTLGLAITDQFIGAAGDRYIEAESILQGLREPYEQVYSTGILYERRAKTQLLVGYPPHAVRALVEEALRCFGEAEKIRPAGNDDSILRWNSCVRLLDSRPEFHYENAFEAMDAEEMPSVTSMNRRAGRVH